MQDQHTNPNPYGRIYVITNLVNGKYYIGQTTRNSLADRWREHCKIVRHGKTYALTNAIRKYGPAAFSVEPLADAANRAEQNALETAWIIATRSYDRETGYNLTFGGEGCPATDEVRQKISRTHTGRKRDPEAVARQAAARRGKPFTPEQRARVSRAMSGRKLSAAHIANLKKKTISPEHRAAVSAARKGKPLSEEHRKKLSIAHKGKRLSEEHKQKISISGLRKARKKVSALSTNQMALWA